jgi:hypothetical protein
MDASASKHFQKALSSTTFPKLESVDIDLDGKWIEELIILLAQACPNLRVIDLR